MNFVRGLFRLWLIASLLWMVTLVVYVEIEGRRRDVADGGSVFVKGWAVIADGWKAEREVAAMREVAAASGGMNIVVPDETSKRIRNGKEVQNAALLFGGMLLGPPLILLVLGAWVIHG
ncbi:hypothetical protein PYH37_000477 [Sinorhizobium numidicum]|uniref:Uncharacterized protein n=1 Tax=Sinorhizobium numidicum TaxID=680248 RepID=A0ABY8CT85_9HYPH|nr:hypothetical protein [Sinorhizobium numidicum]WEX75123.1 hypothetical protein PYH37_000477 [Sinorhizobium numidicum]WEX81117.1 hypothetical protein PYH38_000479 [Sinorhizobium numidicum]